MKIKLDENLPEVSSELWRTDVIAKLESHSARLGDGLAGEPLNDQAAYWRTFDTIQRTISGLKHTPDDLNKLLARLAEREERRAAVLKKQASLEAEIANAQDWGTFPNAHMRDREFDRQRTLRMQLQLLHEGTLLIAPGIAAGRLSDLDARIA